MFAADEPDRAGRNSNEQGFRERLDIVHTLAVRISSSSPLFYCPDPISNLMYYSVCFQDSKYFIKVLAGVPVFFCRDPDAGWTF
jgi:hypothetical protein